MGKWSDPEAESYGSTILLYQTEDGQVQVRVRLDEDTVWLSQGQLADLLGTSKQNVGQHIRNIFSEGELASETVVKDFFTTASDSKKYKTRHCFQHR